MNAFIGKRLADFDPDESLRWLLSLTWRAIFTTNYDRVIERAYDLATNPTQLPVTISSTAELQWVDQLFQVAVYHLHGALFDTKDPFVLLTEGDYARFRDRRKMLFDILKKELATGVILYVGYSNSDPNWQTVLAELQAEFAGAPLPPAYRVAPETDALDREILGSMGIATIDASVDDFVQEIRSQLGDLRVDPAKLHQIRGSIPAQLHAAFDAAPAATLRLWKSWEYVNAVDLAAPPNVDAFLKGERANWPTIFGEMAFRRDVEEALGDALLDYATTTGTPRPTFLLEAPAGYGTTTTLMRLAAMLVREGAGPVFFLRTGGSVSEGDVEYAWSLGLGRPYFVVDNAADHARQLELSISHIRQMKLPGCFLLGERRNEWRQIYRKPRTSEFGIEPLSEPEIDRLLEFLSQHGALNQLERLSSDLRRAAIRQKHDRQLLVTMREVTEGKAFDAIIEDEYRSLANQTTKELYAAVACSYQLRQPLRDQVISHALKKPLTEIYNETRDSSDGVIDFECFDSDTGEYVARCRHHSIAEIVWERCVNDPDRERLLQAIMDALNLMYVPDDRLFDALVRSERDVDVIKSLESKTRFFEKACRKDPRSAYVRQHYARMLLREGKAELALSEIDAAIRMSPQTRVLHHTRGVILREMALSTPSLEIARRRLAQSEDAFYEALRRETRDAYPYQSLAELYLKWAARVPTEDERINYIYKCEEIIGQGLRVVQDRESLWIVSSELQKFLGEQPKAIEILKQASGSKIARHLLAQAHLSSGNFADALPLAESLLREDPHDFRAALLCARALRDSGEGYAKAIAVLRLATLYGMRDPRFIATLGGMLYMEGEYSEADRIFKVGRARQFTLGELKRFEYRPTSDGRSLPKSRFTGTVADVRTGYAWIAIVGLPENVQCPWSKLGSLVLRRAMSVTCDLAFSAEGVYAVGVQAV